MEQDLRARLLAGIDLAAAVSGRIDWGTRPKAANLPALTLSLVSAAVSYTYRGRSRLQSCRVQIDVWGASPGSAITVASLLPPLLEMPADQGATRFGASFVEMELDGGPEEEAGGSIIYRRTLDFTVWHRPAA